MGPDDVDLTRAFVREIGDVVSTSAVRTTQGLQVVVEVEAGANIFGIGAPYITNVTIRNLTTGAPIAARPTAGPNAGVFGGDYHGAMQDASWPAPNAHNQFVWEVPAPLPAGLQNNVCEVIAFLRARTTTPDVEFAISDPFIFTA